MKDKILQYKQVFREIEAHITSLLPEYIQNHLCSYEPIVISPTSSDLRINVFTDDKELLKLTMDTRLELFNIGLNDIRIVYSKEGETLKNIITILLQFIMDLSIMTGIIKMNKPIPPIFPKFVVQATDTLILNSSSYNSSSLVFMIKDLLSDKKYNEIKTPSVFLILEEGYKPFFEIKYERKATKEERDKLREQYTNKVAQYNEDTLSYLNHLDSVIEQSKQAKEKFLKELGLK